MAFKKLASPSVGGKSFFEKKNHIPPTCEKGVSFFFVGVGKLVGGSFFKKNMLVLKGHLEA